MQGIDDDAGTRHAGRVGESARIRQGLDLAIGDELDHGAQTDGPRGLCQPGEIVALSRRLGVAADGEHVPRAEPCAGFGDGSKGARVGAWAEPDRLDIEDGDAGLGQPAFDPAQQRLVADDRHDRVGFGWRHDAKADRVEPAGDRGIDQLDRAGVDDGEVSERQAAIGWRQANLVRNRAGGCDAVLCLTRPRFCLRCSPGRAAKHTRRAAARLTAGAACRSNNGIR